MELLVPRLTWPDSRWGLGHRRPWRQIIERIVVPGGAKAETLRTTFRNGVLDAAFETVRPMPTP